MIEIWKDIEFKGCKYKLSNFGNIIGIKGNKLKTRLDDDGYLSVTLGKTDKRTRVRVHRLVAIYFVPNPNNLKEVNHKDFNRQNCRSDNLEWITHYDNIKYSTKAGNHAFKKIKFKGEGNPNYGNDTLKNKFKNNTELKKIQSRPRGQNGRAKKVVMLYKDKEIKTFDCIINCAEYLINNNYTDAKVENLRNIISKCCKIKNKSYKGFNFKFL